MKKVSTYGDVQQSREAIAQDLDDLSSDKVGDTISAVRIEMYRVKAAYAQRVVDALNEPNGTQTDDQEAYDKLQPEAAARGIDVGQLAVDVVGQWLTFQETMFVIERERAIAKVNIENETDVAAMRAVLNNLENILSQVTLE